MQISPTIHLVFQTSGPQSQFFGFYDESPLDASGQRMLSHRVDFDGRDVTADDSAVIGYWDIETGVFVKLGVTQAFNWQQGARLQWLPPDYSTRIIYNNREADRFISIIVDVKNGQQQVIPFPVYAVHPSGKFALGMNFERLYFCYKGYCYEGVMNPKWNRPIREDDGIFRVDLETGETQLLINTRQVVDLAPLPEMEHGDNWLTHCMWNPSGTRFVFLHRWADPSQWIVPESEKPGETERPFATRLLTANADGSDIYLFPDTKFYSHMGWRNDTEFTIWGRKKDTSKSVFVRAHRAGYYKKSGVMQIGLAVYYWLKHHLSLGDRLSRALVNGPSYLKIRDRRDRIEVLGKGVLTEDGHNTWSRDGRLMLTDTYPDSSRHQRLLIYDADSNRVTELGRFFAPYTKGYRCDLHPRWDHSGTRIVVDSAHEDGKRQMYVFEMA